MSCGPEVNILLVLLKVGNIFWWFWLGFFACFSCLLLLLRAIVLFMGLFEIVLGCCSKLISKTGKMDIRVYWLVSPDIFPPIFWEETQFSFHTNPSRQFFLVPTIFYSHFIPLFPFFLLLFPFCSLLTSKAFSYCCCCCWLLFWGWFVWLFNWKWKWNKLVILWPHVGKLCVKSSFSPKVKSSIFLELSCL